MEDAFVEDNTEYISEDNQWNTLKAARHNDGYREGITDSKESALQSGFNKGFEVGFSCVQQAAKLRGFLWAIIGTIGNGQTAVDEPENARAKEELNGIIQILVSKEQETIKEIQNGISLVDKRDIDNTAKCSFTIADACSLADERVELVKTKLQNDLEEMKKLSLAICVRLKLSDSVINRLKE